MKKLIIFILTIFIISCDDTFEFVELSNEAPQFAFDENFTKLNVNDTLKVTAKSNTPERSVTLYMNDQENQLSYIDFQITDGEGELYANGEPLTNNRINVDTINNITFSFKPTIAGNHSIDIFLYDALNAFTEVQYNLHTFNNLKPIARFSYEKLNINNSKEYILDAAASFDADFNYGGNISIYEWSINDVIILKEHPNTELRHVFPEKGNFEIKLRVMDNDGEFSDYYTDILTI